METRVQIQRKTIQVAKEKNKAFIYVQKSSSKRAVNSSDWTAGLKGTNSRQFSN